MAVQSLKFDFDFWP